MEGGSAVEDSFSSGLPSVEACSVGLSEPDDEAEDVVLMGADAAGEGCGAAEAVLGCKTRSHMIKWQK